MIKKPIFLAKIKERSPLTKSGSTKSTYHIVLDIAGSNFAYNAGDSIGIYPSNDPSLVEQIIRALNMTPNAPITHPKTGESLSLKQFLTHEANLAKVTTSLLKQFQSHPEVQKILNHPLKLSQTLTSYDLLDCALQFGSCSLNISSFISALPPLLPRFYSVASSQHLYPNEAHLLVSLTTFLHHGILRHGVASHFLCHQAEVEKTVIPCYVQPTPHFTLPQEQTAPVIMVGPGTGVAPFRAFLQKRLHDHAPGKNWLFFGERNQATDFFYEEFWTPLVEQQKLSLDLAFSRDQKEKLYVQHRLVEKGAEIWSWLQQKAFFYVCGEADPMAKEVEASFLHICSTHGNLSPEEARNYLKTLRREKRYLIDVY